MSQDSSATRREVIKLGAAGLGAVALNPNNEDSTSCTDIEIFLEETDLNTNYGTQYQLDLTGTNNPVEIYEDGQMVGEFEDGEKIILPSGEYRLETQTECSYKKALTVE